MFSMSETNQTDNALHHEMQFVRNFVIPAKRARYLSLLESRRGRIRFIKTLDHFGDLDMRRVASVPAYAQTPLQIEALLKGKGASGNCTIISSNENLDGSQTSLREALEQTIGQGYGTIISCMAGRLAYFEGEDPGARYILEHSP